MPVCIICGERCDHGNYINVVLDKGAGKTHDVIVCYFCAQLVKETFEVKE